MAYVDFSNAYIECINKKCFETNKYLGLYDGTIIITDTLDYGTPIASISSKYIGNFTTTTATIYYNGVFNTNGNEMVLSYSAGNNQYVGAWKISNIEFENGDEFSFQINIIFS